MTNLHSLHAADYPSKVQKAALPIILDFGAAWCAPCKHLAPILETLALEWTGKAMVYTVDADIDNDLVSQFRVMSLPTLILIKDGKEIQRLVGLQNREKISNLFGAHL
ncbi:MAG TPA: thioredoxin domain-containing protein [Leptolinea sp.]